MKDALPPAIEALLACTVREEVTNVIRHSRARQCTIRVIRNSHDACVEVSDDGAGVLLVTALQQKDVVSTGSMSNGGNGLRGLAERVEALGGLCEARPRADGGFCLSVSVPLAQQNHETETPGTAVTPGIQEVPATSPERSDRDKERSEQL